MEKMRTEELLEQTFGEPDEEAAKEMLQEVSGFKAPIKLKELNDILEYAIKSNVGMDFIADCLNRNGLNIRHYKGSKELLYEQDRFRAFGITGLELTSMDKVHFKQYIDSRRRLDFLEIIVDKSISEKSANEEFVKMYDEIKVEYNKLKNEKKMKNHSFQNIKKRFSGYR